MNYVVIGYAAGFCTTLSFVPQVLRAWRTRSAKDFAWAWLIVFELGLVLWLAYGIALHDWPMIFANSVTISLCSLLMLMKIHFARNAPLQVRAESAD
jgi:MtN3 and saliva related transmembrane protein